MHNSPATPGSLCLAQWCAGPQAAEQLLYLQNDPAPLGLSVRGGVACCELPAGWQGLLAVQGSLLPEQGTARIWPVSANLVKLQFFIDQALPSRPEHVSVPGLVVLPAPQAQVLASGSLERWYLTQALQPNVAGQGLAQALRRRESYQLLEFLNEHAVSGCKLHELAERYGVSVSHFRRLCRQALGSRSKTVLRDWRAARALLAVANGPANLTEVAMHCGYASSSHFSRDIRQILGVMPSSLQDITRLA